MSSCWLPTLSGQRNHGNEYNHWAVFLLKGCAKQSSLKFLHKPSVEFSGEPLQPCLTNTSACLLQTPALSCELYFLSSFYLPSFHKKNTKKTLCSMPRNHRRASHFSPGKILMSLQGPSRSNYVEQLLSVTGPRLPRENTNLPGKQNSPTFDKTLDTQGYK